MYEKFTSCFLMQRASISTLPFGIDDPSSKPAKGSDLSEVLVELYNKGKQGSSGRSSVEPKSIPLVTTVKTRREGTVENMYCSFCKAVNSTAVPTTDKQQEAFDELDDILMGGDLSSVCGWAIKQRASLEDKEKLKAMKLILRPFFQGRSVINWVYVAICLREVSTFICICLLLINILLSIVSY